MDISYEKDLSDSVNCTVTFLYMCSVLYYKITMICGWCINNRCLHQCELSLFVWKGDNRKAGSKSELTPLTGFNTDVSVVVSNQGKCFILIQQSVSALAFDFPY